MTYIFNHGICLFFEFNNAGTYILIKSKCVKMKICELGIRCYVGAEDGEVDGFEVGAVDGLLVGTVDGVVLGAVVGIVLGAVLSTKKSSSSRL